MSSHYKARLLFSRLLFSWAKWLGRWATQMQRSSPVELIDPNQEPLQWPGYDPDDYAQNKNESRSTYQIDTLEPRPDVGQFAPADADSSASRSKYDDVRYETSNTDLDVMSNASEHSTNTLSESDIYEYNNLLDDENDIDPGFHKDVHLKGQEDGVDSNEIKLTTTENRMVDGIIDDVVVTHDIAAYDLSKYDVSNGNSETNINLTPYLKNSELSSSLPDGAAQLPIEQTSEDITNIAPAGETASYSSNLKDSSAHYPPADEMQPSQDIYAGKKNLDTSLGPMNLHPTMADDAIGSTHSPWPDLPNELSHPEHESDVIKLDVDNRTRVIQASKMRWPDLPDRPSVSSGYEHSRLTYANAMIEVKHIQELDTEQKGQLWNA